MPGIAAIEIISSRLTYLPAYTPPIKSELLRKLLDEDRKLTSWSEFILAVTKATSPSRVGTSPVICGIKTARINVFLCDGFSRFAVHGVPCASPVAAER